MRRVALGLGVLLTLVVGVLVWRLLVPPGIHEAVAVLRHLDDVVDEGGARDMQGLFPEGFLFTHVVVGLAWVDVGLTMSKDDPLRAHAVERARASLAAATSSEGRRPFPESLPPDHGAFYAGWTTWLRAGIVALDPQPDERLALAQACTDIAAAYDASEHAFLASYRGASWPVDSVVAVSVLAPCEVLTGADHQATIDRWIRLARPTDGPLLAHEADAGTGRPLSAPRGTSTAMMLRFLHEIDPAWSSEMYTAFREQMVVQRFGLPGVLEHIGGDGVGDVDSGPLIEGVSVSASAVAAGAARIHGDDVLADSLLSVGEVAALPFTWNGRRRYAMGVLPVGDAFGAWTLVARARVRAPPSAGPAPQVSRWWRLPWVVLLLGPVVAGWITTTLRT